MMLSWTLCSLASRSTNQNHSSMATGSITKSNQTSLGGWFRFPLLAPLPKHSVCCRKRFSQEKVEAARWRGCCKFKALKPPWFYWLNQAAQCSFSAPRDLQRDFCLLPFCQGTAAGKIFAVLKYTYHMQQEPVMKGFASRTNKGHIAPETSPS